MSKKNTPIALVLRSLRYDEKLHTKKYQQNDIADAAGISSGLLSNFENGRQLPTDDQLKRLLKVYKLTRENFESLVMNVDPSTGP